MIECHADDYGLFPGQSGRIRACMGPEGVNGVSILANSPNLAQEMKALAGLPGDARVAVHLNLVEGKPLTAASALPHLTNADGIFDVSFGRLLAASVIPGRRQKYASEIRREFAAQIAEAEKYLGKAPLRLDGHVHYHMIPVVFDAMMDLIREEGLKVEYIRIPSEAISLYWKHRKELTDFRWINLVKVLVLNVLAFRNRLKYGPFLKQTKEAVFVGVMLSGRMSTENVRIIWKDAVSLAEDKGQDLEILFHPGYVEDEADARCLTAEGDREFMTEKWRIREGEAAGKLFRHMSDHYLV